MLTIISIPSYTDIITGTTTAYASGLFTDLLPWVGALIGLVIAGVLLVAIRRGVVGGIKRVFGGGRGRGRRGRGRR